MIIIEKYIDLDKNKDCIRYINNTEGFYVSNEGDIYKEIEKGKLIKKKQYLSKSNGYMYVNIKFKNDKRYKSRRVHRLVALAFIDNPNNYDTVGHKNNIKTDNYVSNLYWTTIQENTQKAVDDGLLINDKGFEDSQSKTVIAYKNNEIYKIYGSLRICSKELGIPIQTIIRRCDNSIKTNYRKYKEFDFKYFNQ